MALALGGSSAAWLMFGPGPAVAQLQSQNVRGADRICVYRVGNEDRTMRVGRGEPCPQRFRAPPAPPSPVPIMATLQRQRATPRGLECIYTYNQRAYSVIAPQGGRCPYTPHFATPAQ